MTFDRRSIIKSCAAAAATLPRLVSDASAQVFKKDEAEKVLFPVNGVAGGGQLENSSAFKQRTGAAADPRSAQLAFRLGW